MKGEENERPAWTSRPKSKSKEEAASLHAMYRLGRQ